MSNRHLSRHLACAFFAAVGLSAASAQAEVTLVETGGWAFFADGRVNGFLSHGFGDGFPKKIPPPRMDPADPNSPALRAEYSIIQGWSGYRGDPSQEDTEGDYSATRVRSGFVGSVFGFGIKRDVTPTTTVKGYVGIWTSIAAVARKRLPDSNAPLTNTDARQGYLTLSGPWGDFTGGRDLGLFGRISTETDFLYGHGVGLGLPCMDRAGNPACGHIGTGVMGAAFGSGFMYSTPELAGLKLSVGLYDPVRILGGWVAADYPRPEAQLAWSTQLGDAGMLKLAVEGLYQGLRYPEAPNAVGEEGADPADTKTTVWGVTAGARAEVGPARLGVSGFHGPGLGFYTSFQNDPVMFNTVTGELRTFTGFYGQAALVFAPWQFSLGAGRAMVDQLDDDKVDVTIALPQSQTGLSAGVAYKLTDNFSVGVDFLRFMVKWYPVPNSHIEQQPDPLNPMAMIPANVIDPGTLPQHEQNVNFVNVGATFQW